METTPLIKTTTSTTRTKSNYNRLACCYNSWSSWEQPYLDAAFDLLNIQPTDSILDIGCATGTLLARAGNITHGKVTGIDLSSAMCKISRKHCEELECSVNIVCGDAFELLQTSSDAIDVQFDCIAMTFTLELFDDKDALLLLKSAALRLRPDSGRMVIVSMSSAVKKGCSMWCYGCFRCCCSCVVDCRPIDLNNLVDQVDELEIKSRCILPMYGLAVEIVEVQRRYYACNKIDNWIRE